jgi:hypothetical protein
VKRSEGYPGAGRVLLISTYELGHQPLHLASPPAALAAAGHRVRCIDLSVEQLDRDKIDWAEAVERLAISNDCFALFDPNLPRPGKPRVPHPAFNWSTDAARESIRKLAKLKPAVCWPGHYGPLTGDVGARLEAIV